MFAALKLDELALNDLHFHEFVEVAAHLFLCFEDHLDVTVVAGLLGRVQEAVLDGVYCEPWVGRRESSDHGLGLLCGFGHEGAPQEVLAVLDRAGDGQALLLPLGDLLLKFD